MKTKSGLLLVLLCAIFLTSCSNESADFDEPTETLTYDDVRQYFLDAGFKLNVPVDSSVVVIKVNSPQEALTLLNSYIADDQFKCDISRSALGTVIYFDTYDLPNGETSCSFKHEGLRVQFTMTKDFRINEEKRIRLDLEDKSYKYKDSGLRNYNKDLFLWALYVKPISFEVDGEVFTKESELGFKFQLVLGSGFAVALNYVG